MFFNGVEYLTTKELCQKYTNISEGQLRSWLRQRRENGLQKAVYIINKRTFLIRVDVFFDWLESRRDDRIIK